MTVGRALAAISATEAAEDSAWQLVETSVVPPVNTVRPDSNAHQLRLGLMVCGMTTLITAAQFASRGREDTGQPSFKGFDSLDEATGLEVVDRGSNLMCHIRPVLLVWYSLKETTPHFNANNAEITPVVFTVAI